MIGGVSQSQERHFDHEHCHASPIENSVFPHLPIVGVVSDGVPPSHPPTLHSSGSNAGDLILLSSKCKTHDGLEF